MSSKVSSIEDYHDIIRAYDPLKNSTRNFMTKYEKVKIIGLRAEQLQRGAVPYVEFDKKNFNPIDIALKELDARKIPFMICRTLPNGEKEYWRLDDMIML
jgi:DNA-directed RNA polymerase I, II, and III subunit RPABC2